MDSIRHLFLEEYSKGEKITSADSDLQFCVDTQNARLKEKGVSLDYSFQPRGRDPEGKMRPKEWGDGHYLAKMNNGTCSFKRVLKKGDKRLFAKKMPAEIRVVVTDVRQNQNVEDDIYVCPNCGHPSKIKELIEGCPFCTTKFKIDELYPKVSNFNVVRDYELTQKEVISHYLLPAVLIVAAAAITFPIAAMVLANAGAIEMTAMDMENILLQAAIVSPFYGAVYGGMFLVGCMIAESVRSAPITLTFHTHKLFEDEMKKHGQDFMTQYFIGKTVSKLKTVIFSSDPSVLPFYTGPALPPDTKDIVDIIFRGGLAFKDVQVSDNVAHVDADIYTEVLSEKDEKVERKNRIFHVKMAKNLSTKTSLDFSIKKLQCDSCGASFDAYKNKICPFCGNEYKMLDSDWVIESIKTD